MHLSSNLSPDDSEWLVIRRVFPTWSIEIPQSLDETFVQEGNYWHAWDEKRSVSLTSIRLSDDHGPVSERDILAQMRPDSILGTGPSVEGLPAGLNGWAITGPSTMPARASQMLTGLLAIDGCVLLVTITSDDLDWARATWLSIRRHRPPLTH